MPRHVGRRTPLLPTSARETKFIRVTFWRSLCFASVVALAGCTYGNGGPTAAIATTVAPTPASASAVVPATAPVTVATPAVAVAPTQCRSNDDCGVNRAGGLCMPKPVTKEMSNGEDFLERAMGLNDLVTRLGDTSSSAPIPTLLQQVRDDLSTYSQMARGRIPDGAGGTRVVVGDSPTKEQMQYMQDAAWLQSGATQAEMIIRQFLSVLSRAPITTDALDVYADITGDSGGIHLDKVVRDLRAFLRDIEVAAAPLNELVELRNPDGSALDLKSGAGALAHYIGPVLKTLNEDRSDVGALVEPARASRLDNDLRVLSRGLAIVGKDGNAGTCLEAR